MTKFEVDEKGVPRDPSAYRFQEFWEQKYASGDHHDWMTVPLSTILPYIGPRNNHINSVLILGCGTSEITASFKEELEGCEVFAVDYSLNAIKYMQPLNPHINWSLMDITQLALRSNQFDIVFEKITLDALWSDTGSPWEPRGEILENVKAAVTESCRVLRPGGIFLSLSLAPPHFRIKYYRDWCTWSIIEEPVNIGTFSYLYKMVK